MFNGNISKQLIDKRLFIEKNASEKSAFMICIILIETFYFNIWNI